MLSFFFFFKILRFQDLKILKFNITIVDVAEKVVLFKSLITETVGAPLVISLGNPPAYK